ncbi:MAG: FHA domain-containing protein [Bacteroidales bacterium]|nr:FHA domain-containing protein [Bacteroidales bacterium]
MIGRDFSSVYARQLQGLGSMSRRHGKLIKNGSQWAFMDLGSSYGTTINGMSCVPNQQYSINTGDTIVFARTYTFNVN